MLVQCWPSQAALPGSLTPRSPFTSLFLLSSHTLLRQATTSICTPQTVGTPVFFPPVLPVQYSPGQKSPDFPDSDLHLQLQRYKLESVIYTHVNYSTFIYSSFRTSGRGRWLLSTKVSYDLLISWHPSRPIGKRSV